MTSRTDGWGVRLWLGLLLLMVSGLAGAQTGVVSEIVISGNTNVTQEAILAQMKTQVGQPYVQAQLEQDRIAIENIGFFKAVDVTAVPVENDNWRVTVNVSEFDVVKEIRIVGNTVIPESEILKAVTIEVGKPFNLRNQRPSGEAISRLYLDKGYFALVEELLPMEDSPSTVSIVIREVKVNDIIVRGNTRTRDWVMDRLIKTEPGEVYNENRWISDLRRIFSTQWFEKVDPSERATEDGYGVDLILDVKEARTGQVIVGLTMDPRSTFGGTARILETNFRGTGQTVSLNALQAVGGGGTSVSLDYTNPFMDNRDTALNVSLYSQVFYRFAGTGFGGGSVGPTDDRYFERHSGFGLALSRPTSANTTASIGLKGEVVDTSELSTTATTGFIQQDSDLLLLSLGFNRNTRDLDIDPSRGDWLNLTVEPGFTRIRSSGGAFPDPSLIGNHTFVRSTVEYRKYFTNQPPRGTDVDAPRRVFAFRARYGVISGTVPFAEQFFVGGSDTLRGYQDDRFWGKQTFLATLEYRHPIQKAFNIVGFVDYGGAWGGYGDVNEFTQSRTAKLNLGYGVGFSFKTPLGPIRLDFAFNERGGSRTHFLIGTSF